VRRIFLTRKEKVRVEWRTMHKEILHSLYSSANFSWSRNKMSGHWIAEKGIYKVSRKSQLTGPLERPMHRWEDNIKVDLKYGVFLWSALSGCSVPCSKKHSNGPWGFIKGGKLTNSSNTQNK
jgi:hypothetical protein